MKIIGFKELVKKGEMEPSRALSELERKARKNNGERAIKWVRSTKTYAWLKRRASN